MRALVFAALAATAVLAQDLPDASALMKEHEAAMKHVHTLEYKANMTMEMTRQGQTMRMAGEVLNEVVNPGKTRMETLVQGVRVITVSNGEATWIYNSMNKQYTKRSAALGPMATLSAMGLNNLPDTSKMKIDQKTVGSETVEMGGQKYDCWVVENRVGDFTMTAAAPVTMKDALIRYWIDKKSKMDLQMAISMKISSPAGEMAMSQKFTKTELKIDQPIADSEFSFSPPEGARLVDTVMGAGATSDLAGTEAAPFEVKTLEGKPFSLAALKGKPVLLDFWASWCGPCRRAMPDVEAVEKQYRGQGLVVLGVNTGEERDVVESFLKKNPLTYPEVLSGDSGILEAYQVSSYPTFVLIGRDGKIAAYQVGYGDIAMLRGMLAKAGIK